MINYKRGDVVLVPFPFSNQTTIKKRPAISTIEKTLILKNLGKLSDRDMYSMNNALSELFELDE
jgi:hypothetical protein